MDEQSAEFTQAMVQVTAHRASLVDGLIAAAADSSSPRVAAALRELAGQLERGQPLDDLLTAPDSLLPAAVRGLLRAAARTGRMGEALTELVEQQRVATALGRSIRGALAYPLIVVGMGCLVLTAVMLLMVPPFKAMFDDFGMTLPMLTLTLFWWWEYGLLVMAGGVLLVVLALAAVSWRGGRAALLRLSGSVPLFGPLWQWAGLADWLGLMTMLVRNQVPLPEALRLSAAGVRNPLVAQRVERFASGAESGETLSRMLAAGSQLPASLVPLVRWGEAKGALADALAAGHEMFQMRVRQRSLLLQAVLPPILFLGVGCGVLFVIGGLFLPLMSMIQSLS